MFIPMALLLAVAFDGQGEAVMVLVPVGIGDMGGAV